MDAAELKRRIAAAREFEHVLDFRGQPVTYRLRTPEPLVMRSTMRAHNGTGGVDWDAVIRDLTPAHVVGWKGVPAGMFLSDLSLEESMAGVPFEADLVLPLLSRHTDHYDALANALLERYKAERERIEADLKN